jgi:hypothetical protein
VAAAALAVRARFAAHTPIWTVIGAVTRWQLLPLPAR